MSKPEILAENVKNKSHCLYTMEQINQALDQMAQAISDQLADKNPIILCAMKGAFLVTASLLERFSFPLQLDYIHASRYQGQTTPGPLHLVAKPSIDLRDRHVLVVEDMLEGGVTMANIIQYCQEQGAKHVYSAALLEKKRPREPGGLEKADFTGFEVEDIFIFGFGMDYQGYLRNMPGIYAVTEEIS